MPFDNPAQRTVATVLDNMIQRLAPNGWCQYVLHKPATSEHQEQFCLMGALNAATNLDQSPWYTITMTPVKKQVIQALVPLQRGDESSSAFLLRQMSAICRFNNSHSYAEVMQLLTEARASLGSASV